MRASKLGQMARSRPCASCSFPKNMMLVCADGLCSVIGKEFPIVFNVFIVIEWN